MKVRILWNAEPTQMRFLTGYKPEHAPHMQIAAGTDCYPEDPDVPDEAILEGLFRVLNADDRPNAQSAPSMSVGDVVVLDLGGPDQRAYAVASIGFERIEWQDEFAQTPFDPRWN